MIPPRFQVRLIRKVRGVEVEHWLDQGHREGRAHRIANAMRRKGHDAEVFLVAPVTQPLLTDQQVDELGLPK